MTSKGYILCVDDDDDDCTLLGEAMQEHYPHIDVRFLDSGDKALKYLSEALANFNLPSIIVMDVNMPGLNGLQTLREIKGLLKSQVPVVFLTTTPRNQDILAGQADGASLMKKPTSAHEYSELAHTLVSLLVHS